MADNEMLVLMYETLQKQLSEMKNSRIVVQSLCDRVSKLEKTIDEMDKRSDEIETRLEVINMVLKGLNDMSASNKNLATTVNALRSTIEHVTNPSISIIANTHKDIKQSIRELSTAHREIMDEFEQYALRLAATEDRIRQLKTNTLLQAEAEEKKEDE